MITKDNAPQVMYFGRVVGIFLWVGFFHVFIYCLGWLLFPILHLFGWVPSWYTDMLNFLIRNLGIVVLVGFFISVLSGNLRIEDNRKKNK